MTTDLAKFHEVISPAPVLLEKSTERVEKAKEFGLQLLARIEEAGMNEQMDQEANDYLVKVRKTAELIHDQRKPITQLLDQVKKNFTTLEAELSPKTNGGIYSQVQTYRDSFAKKKLEEQRKREEEAQRKRAIEDEKVKIREEIETKLADYFINHLRAKKDELYNLFNNTTLEKFDDYKEAISTFPDKYSDGHYKAFKTTAHTIYLTTEEKARIKAEVMEEKQVGYAASFQAEISELKKYLFDMLPSKKTELEAIAKADKEEAKRLQKEKEEREKKEKERLASEAEERRQQEEQAARARKEESSMNNLFNAAADAKDQEGPTQERSGYNIIVTHPAGYVQIFQFWFEDEGSNLSMETIEKRTVKQMKAHCEKIAHKTGEMIKSPYIKYEEIVKTRARS